MSIEVTPGGWVPLLVRAEDYEEFCALVAHRERQRGIPKATGAQNGPTGPGQLGAGGLSGSDRAAEDPKEVRGRAQREAATEALNRLRTWDEGSLQLLASGLFKTTRNWALALDVASRSPGTFLSSDEIAASGEMSIAQWRDAARKMPRHLQTHYDVPGLPMCSLDGRFLGRQDGQIYWAVTREQASRWLRVRGT